jgi:hypothetical protein
MHDCQTEDICIEDFNGYISPGHFPTSFAADWCPIDKVVRFTGDWSDVPDMPAEQAPSDTEVNKWAEDYIARS